MTNFNFKLFKSLNESEYKELYTPKRTLTEATTDANEIAEEYKEAYHIDLDWNRVPCVIARDKFLSGWGGAEGKTHYQVVLCGDSTEAANIEANMRSLGRKEGLANIRRDFGVHLSSRVSKAYVVGRYASAWNNLSKSWYESRFDSGKTEDEINKRLPENSLKEHIENINDNPTYLKIVNFIDNIIYSEEDEDRKQICTQLKKDMDIFGSLKESEKLKEEYSEKLGGDPEDFISDVELILNKLKEIDSTKLGTHLAQEIVDQFIDTCNSQIDMAKSRFLGESDLGIDLSPDEEQIYNDIMNRNYDDIYNNLDNEEKEEYQKVASTIRTLKPDEAFIDVEKEVKEKAKENHLETDILTYVYLSKYNKKSKGKKLNEDEDTVHKIKDCTDDVEVIMALEGDTLELDDMEDWNRLKELAKSLSRSQGFYGRLLASMEEVEEEDLEFPIYL